MARSAGGIHLFSLLLSGMEIAILGCFYYY